MCLVVNKLRHWRNKPKIAKRDIRCYKVFLSVNDNTFMSPHQFSGLHWDQIRDCYESKVFDEVHTSKDHCVFSAIHSYKTYKLAMSKADKNTIIIACYIPKGTKYWIGKYGDYASERIKFN